jgi:hypothetical protein
MHHERCVFCLQTAKNTRKKANQTQVRLFSLQVFFVPDKMLYPGLQAQPTQAPGGGAQTIPSLLFLRNGKRISSPECLLHTCQLTRRRAQDLRFEINEIDDEFQAQTKGYFSWSRPINDRAALGSIR